MDGQQRELLEHCLRMQRQLLELQEALLLRAQFSETPRLVPVRKAVPNPSEAPPVPAGPSVQVTATVNVPASTLSEDPTPCKRCGTPLVPIPRGQSDLTMTWKRRPDLPAEKGYCTNPACDLYAEPQKLRAPVSLPGNVPAAPPPEVPPCKSCGTKLLLVDRELVKVVNGKEVHKPMRPEQGVCPTPECPLFKQPQLLEG